MVSRKSRFRFGELVIAIAILALGLIWAERIAWNQISGLREENYKFIERIGTDNDQEAKAFIEKTNRSLERLQQFLLASIICLIAAGSTIIWLAYRRMISPLQTTLTESRAIIERQEKLASLGVFATGIAHEIRNPLTAIKVRLFTLKQGHQPGTSDYEDIEVIGNEIDRLELIVKEFLQFARPADPELRPIPLPKLLQDVHQLLEVEFQRRNIQLVVETPPDEVIEIDPNKIKQALLNFIQNAADAIQQTGTVTVKAHFAKRILHNIQRSVVIIDITDTGSGMPVDIQKRLFDPFFTTKEEGTGLGLPIAARIIEKHGGAIEYQTAPNQGTTFSIILPRNTHNEHKS